MIDPDKTDDLLGLAWMTMRRRGMKQKTLAAELGITEKHMSHLFRGKAQPSIAMLRRILAVLDLELVARPTVLEGDLCYLLWGFHNEHYCILPKGHAETFHRCECRDVSE